MEIKDDVVTISTQEFCDMMNAQFEGGYKSGTRKLKQDIEKSRLLEEFAEWCDYKSIIDFIYFDATPKELVTRFMNERYDNGLEK